MDVDLSLRGRGFGRGTTPAICPSVRAPPSARKTKEEIVTIQEQASKNRAPEYPAKRIFGDRCSPRGFTQDQIPEGF